MARSTAPTAPLRERMAETVTTKEPVAVHLLLLPPLRAPSFGRTAVPSAPWSRYRHSGAMSRRSPTIASVAFVTSSGPAMPYGECRADDERDNEQTGAHGCPSTITGRRREPAGGWNIEHQYGGA